MLVGADHSGREGVMFSPWLVEGVGRQTRARIDARDRNILQLTVFHFDMYISWKLLLWQVSSFFFALSSIPSPHIQATVCLSDDVHGELIPSNRSIDSYPSYPHTHVHKYSVHVLDIYLIIPVLVTLLALPYTVQR